MKAITFTVILVAAVALVVLVAQVHRVMGQAVLKEPAAAGTPSTQPAGPLGFVVKDIQGKDYNLEQLKGKVVLMVNVASKCGFTKQYTGLEKLYEAKKDQGLVIVGFPANNFKGQEPGTNEEIAQFCSSKYNVTFPLMSKISVKGDDIHPLYKYLTQQTPKEFNGDIGWNFNKFLVDRSGQVFGRFGSKTTPEDEQLVGAIDKALAAK